MMTDKQIEIKGRKFSEETIIEALKAHTDWLEKPTIKLGDIVAHVTTGQLRFVINDGRLLATVDSQGKVMARGSDINLNLYRYVGRCTGFEVKSI